MEGMMGRKTMMMKWSFRCFSSFLSFLYLRCVGWFIVQCLFHDGSYRGQVYTCMGHGRT